MKEPLIWEDDIQGTPQSTTGNPKGSGYTVSQMFHNGPWEAFLRRNRDKFHQQAPSRTEAKEKAEKHHQEL